MVRQGSPAFGGIREVGAHPVPRGPRRHAQPARAAGCGKSAADRAPRPAVDAERKPRPRSRLFSVCSGNRDLEESITTAIISEEEIADGASPELLSIRRELRRVSGKVRGQLNRMISGERSKYFQENIITQRNGRFVVPVRRGAPRRCARSGAIPSTGSDRVV